jgi:hypothetical protein
MNTLEARNEAKDDFLIRDEKGNEIGILYRQYVNGKPSTWIACTDFETLNHRSLKMIKNALNIK